MNVNLDEHKQITKYAEEHHKTISQVVLERLEFLHRDEETDQA